jgi:hypothetical protein
MVAATVDSLLRLILQVVAVVQVQQVAMQLPQLKQVQVAQAQILIQLGLLQQTQA